MLKNELIRKAITEIEYPTFAATKQYLEVHEVETKNGKPKIERIDFESSNEFNIIYFSIKDEPFFLSVHFSKNNNEIINVGTENGNQVYLTATSNELTFEELSQITTLNNLSGWSINDDRKNGKGKYNFSRLSFEPIKSRAYDLETKLKLLLTDLEKDVDGVRQLTLMASTIISIHHQQYIDGNKGIHLDLATITRLNKLNLGVDIDQYVFGNTLKST